MPPARLGHGRLACSSRRTDNMGKDVLCTTSHNVAQRRTTCCAIGKTIGECLLRIGELPPYRHFTTVKHLPMIGILVCVRIRPSKNSIIIQTNFNNMSWISDEEFHQQLVNHSNNYGLSPLEREILYATNGLEESIINPTTTINNQSGVVDMRSNSTGTIQIPNNNAIQSPINRINQNIEFVAGSNDSNINQLASVDRGNQVYRFMIRWSIQSNWDIEGFKNKWRELKQIFDLEEDYVFQLECTGDRNYHYQCYLKTKVKIRPLTLAAGLRDRFPGIHVEHMKAKDEIYLKDYCMKNDTRVDGPWTKRRIYRGQDLPTILWPWQQKVLDMILEPPGDRKILWLYDPKGNKGKTKFCKYMSYHHKCVTMGYGSTANLLNLVSKTQNRLAYFFDLTRCKPKDIGDVDLYSTIESIKNGHFCNTKYETMEVLMDIPHVVVFSNSLPHIQNLTVDRWSIQEINDVKDLQPSTSNSNSNSNN